MNSKLLPYLKYLNRWLIAYVKSINKSGVIVGISGGIDSAVVANIATMSKQIKVLGVWMNINNSKLDFECVKELKKTNKFEIIDIDLTNIFNGFAKTLKIKNKLALANLKSRLRMNTLYALAQEKNLIVCGSSNADELYLGYFTKFGDGGCDIMPISQLVKSRVKEAANLLNVPKIIIERKPTASLSENQYDENDIGVSYQEIDKFMINKQIKSNEKNRLIFLHKINSHKLSMPIKPKTFEKIK